MKYCRVNNFSNAMYTNGSKIFFFPVSNIYFWRVEIYCRLFEVARSVAILQPNYYTLLK